ncbi:Ger(x)C family spore germination protein [Bacillus spongiae]|uniref:Ger(X)C family spore germination protein n=1 Tax=Bacillus spongiae TaxID=2683610 RepID=A0ABU8HE63_9BACI
MLKLLLLLLSSTLLLSGCYNNYGIDDLAMINALGFDLSEEEENYLNITAVYPHAMEDELVYEILQATGNSTKDVAIEIMGQTSLEIVNGQLEIMLFGEELAEQGIFPILETSLRDPSFGSRVVLAVAEESAKGILETKLEGQPNIGLYLEDMMEKFDKTFIFPSVNVFQFTRSYYDDGIDPFLPIIENIDKHLSFKGFALFNEDKLVTMLPKERAVFLFFLSENFRKGLLDIDLKKGDPSQHIHLAYVQNNHKVKVKRKEDNSFSIDISIDFTGSLEEYTGDLKIEIPADQKKLEETIEEFVNEETKNLVAFLQENNVDNIGLGQYVRSHLSYEEWTKLNWDEVYPEIEVSIRSNVQLGNLGKSY